MSDQNNPLGAHPTLGYPTENNYPPVNSQYQTQPLHSGYAAPPGPVLQQPNAQTRGGANWMTVPQIQTACPPGLEYLSSLDCLKVHQQLELVEIILDFETNNKYHILNGLGQVVYAAAEENDCCTRNCCGAARPFNLNVLDCFGQTIIRLDRPLACQSCCFPCCLQTLEVFAPVGNLVGSVRQRWSLCTPTFDILDERGDVVLKVIGPIFQCGTSEFDVFSKDGTTKVGKITKEWGGLVQELFTDADNFGITFPVDLDVKIKAVLLGALFLIDYMYFERSGNEGC